MEASKKVIFYIGFIRIGSLTYSLGQDSPKLIADWISSNVTSALQDKVTWKTKNL